MDRRLLRPAFTLIELLVVLAIIGVLVGLLMPAVQKVREAGYRASCLNNLRQIGVAMHHYHDVKQQLPPGFISTAAAINDEGQGPGWGWGAFLLPYLEQDPLFKRIDFTIDLADPIHAQVRFAPLKVFLCPSDAPQSQTVTVPGSLGTINVAFANYVGMGGTFEVTAFPDTGTGVLFRNSKIKFADISDGTSTTILATERIYRRSPLTTWVGAVTGSVNPPVSPANEEEGPPTLVLTNTGTAADGRVPNNPLDHVEDAASLHTMGVNAVMCDGSVQFIRNGISGRTWEALGTRAANDLVGSDF